MENLLLGFSEYRMLILKELERSDERLNNLEASINAIQKELIKLQMKSGVLGALMGLATAGTAFFLSH